MTHTKKTETKYLTTSQVAQRAGLSAKAVQWRIEHGKYRAIKDEHGWWLVEAASVDEYEARQQAVAAAHEIERAYEQFKHLSDPDRLQWLIDYWTAWLKHHREMLARGYKYTLAELRYTSPASRQQVDKVTATEQAISKWQKELQRLKKK